MFASKASGLLKAFSGGAAEQHGRDVTRPFGG